MKTRVKRVNDDYPLPDRVENGAGNDLYCVETVTIEPHSVGLVKSGIAVEVPVGFFLLLASRSSTAINKGLMLANGIGVVDPFYSGDKDEIKLMFLNFTNKPVTVQEGEKLVQALLVKNETIDWQEVDTLGRDGQGYWK